MKKCNNSFVFKSIFLSILVSFFVLRLSGQACPATSQNAWEWPTHSNWFLGDGNIMSFPAGGGNPTVKNVFLPNNWNPSVNSYEGTAVISDDSGNLLNYTNGRIMWDANRNVVYSGFLTGNEEDGSRGTPGGITGSATQGVITVRHPLNPDVVYVFTTDDAITISKTNGFNYWTVNTKTKVISGPIRLGNFRTCEGVDATFHANGVDVWIMVRQSPQNTSENDFRKFNAYLLTCTGLNTVPVISDAGPPVDETSPTDYNRERGALKFSWDSKRLCAVSHLPLSGDFGDAMTVYDFNNLTGALSNVRSFSGIMGQWNWNGATYYDAYDVEWAPNNNAVYISMTNSSNLYWYDITSNNGATIYATQKTITTGAAACALQMGRNGKLYWANINSNSVVEISGNLNAGTGITKKTIALPNVCQRGLPSFFLPPADEPDIHEVGPFCNTDAPVDLTTLWLCKGTNAEDPSGTPPSVYSGTGITDAGKGIFSPAVAGQGTHQIIFTKCSVDDTIWITVNKCNTTCLDTTLKNIAPVCAGSTIDLNTQKITVEPGVWSIQGSGINYPTLSGNVFITTLTTAPGTYVVRYTLNPAPSDNTCPKYSERAIKVNGKPVVTLKDTTICEGAATAKFDAGTGYTYLWSSGENSQSILKTQANTYTVYVSDPNGCKDTASAILIVNVKPSVTLSDKEVCEGGGAVQFDAGIGFASYQWNYGAVITQTYSTSFPGLVTVVVETTKGCKDTATANLIVNAKPNIILSDKVICAGDAAVSFDAGAGFSYVWSNGATTQAINTNTGDTYSVIVTSLKNCKDTVKATLTVNTLPVLELGPNITICPGSVATLTPQNNDATWSYLWSNSSTQNNIAVSAANTYSLTITDLNNCKATDAIDVIVNANLTVDVGLDKEICFGNSAVFTANYAANGVVYTWTGSNSFTANTQSISVTDPGNYHVHVEDPLGCMGDDDVNLIVNPLPKPSVADHIICEGENAMFDAGNFQNYLWSTGEITATINKNVAANYSVVVTDTKGCKGGDTATLLINKNPIVDLGNDYEACEGLPANLDASNTGSTFLWSNSFTTQSIQVSVSGIYSVLVTDVNQCKGYDTVNVSFVEIPSVEIGEDINICEGEEANINATMSPASAVVSWSTQDNGLSINVAQQGLVVAMVSNGGQCFAFDTTHVFVHSKPKGIPLIDQTVCFIDTPDGISIDAGVAAANYHWSNGDTTRIIKITNGGHYSVDLMNEFGCQSSESIDISEWCESTLFIPNSFTPNGDPKNDRFYAYGTNIYDFELWIFDRWGEMIYHSTDINEGWNGRRNNTMQEAQIDVYVYKLKYHFWEDKELNKPLRERVGHVSIIR